MRALIFAHGELPSAALLSSLSARADTIVAADGGANGALARGIRVDAVVGDLDSLDETARGTLALSALHFDPDPDATDLQKAIAFAIANGATAIDIVAAGGGRADHALANLSVLRLFRGTPMVIHDDLFEISLVDGRATVDAAPGTVVSLVALGECTGVTTTGMRWDLVDHTLGFSPRGVHNEIVESPASVSVRSGDLLLFKGRWVEKHG